LHGTLTERLWAATEHTYDAILAHPFIAGLGDGTLPREAFRYFLVQDALYLRTYSKALSTLGGRAPTIDDTEFFATRAARAIAVERALHAGLLRQLDIDSEEVSRTELSPTTRAYTSFIRANVHGGSFLEGLSAVLPCFWIYLRVGEHLARQGSSDPLYQQWIDAYDSEDFTAGVHAALALADRLGETSGADELRRAFENYAIGSTYEWMFWDAAWRQERWPLEMPSPAGIVS
jgi:thiaminase (transcriptional activator TenA)